MYAVTDSTAVFWNDYGYRLNLQSGVWEIKDQKSIQWLCSKAVSLKQTESKQLQRSTILLLELTSSHKVPISCLVIDKSLAGANDEGIILESGIHIPVLSTIEKIICKSEKGTKMTQDETLGVLSYAQKCHNLKNLTFIDCLLPLSFSLESLSSFMKSKHPQVLWQPLKHELRLDISKGTWKLGNSQDSLVLNSVVCNL
ncbi:hypothetical protein BSL78_22905 [Apostichopus japonicus]|uniref:Uncharacterized protein n=1 Tax=Stichopus japonicus TaxID=307972 RepID=A0A2G8JX08_STIJA|nr:hypothetical protein BSL78_22905 [Apostichopus japonicus]